MYVCIHQSEVSPKLVPECTSSDILPSHTPFNMIHSNSTLWFIHLFQEQKVPVSALRTNAPLPSLLLLQNIKASSYPQTVAQSVHAGHGFESCAVSGPHSSRVSSVIHWVAPSLHAERALLLKQSYPRRSFPSFSISRTR